MKSFYQNYQHYFEWYFSSSICTYKSNVCTSHHFEKPRLISCQKLLTLWRLFVCRMQYCRRSDALMYTHFTFLFKGNIYLCYHYCNFGMTYFAVSIIFLEIVVVVSSNLHWKQIKKTKLKNISCFWFVFCINYFQINLIVFCLLCI